MNFAIIHDCLREKHALPSEFEFYSWAMGPSDARPEEWFFATIKGCLVDARFKSGKRKGEANYKKCSDHRTFHVQVSDAEILEREWSAKTGNCIKCVGKGQLWTGTNFVTHVTTYKPCDKCGATGKIGK